MTLWQRSAAAAYGAVMLGVLGHASSEFVAVASGVGGPEASVWRFLLGGAGLVVLALALPGSRDLITPVRERPLAVLALSLGGVTGGYLIFHWSLDFATVPQVATMVTIAPILVAIINLLVNRQPIGAVKIMTGVCAFVGAALIVTDGYLARLAGEAGSLFGVLLALTCAAAISAYAVLIRPLIAEYGALRMTTITMFLGGLGLWVLVGAVWGIWVDPATLPDRPPGQMLALLILAFWNTTITQFLWIGGLATVPDITRGSYLFFLKPAIAAVLAYFFLGQPVTGIQILAMVVIGAAVAIEFAWIQRRR